MPIDEPFQSAYRYRINRYRNQTDDDKTPKKSDSVESNSISESKENRPRLDSTKLSTDPFMGTIAGRLAQEIHDEFLVCKICFDSYTNPKCLTCLHTFCSNCIEKHISAEVCYNRYTDYRDFTCPLCRKRTQLPLGGVKKLPDNFLISGLTELVLRQRASSNSSSSTITTTTTNTITSTMIDNSINKQNNYNNINDYNNNNSNDILIGRRHHKSISNESMDSLHQLPNLDRRNLRYGECEICSQINQLKDRGHSTEPMCKTNQLDNEQRASSANLSMTPQATHKCLDCNKLLCTECVQRHRITKVTKDHATFILQSHCNIECKEHNDEIVRFYCNDCSLCICVLCTFNTHREHNVTSFGEAITQLRYDLNNNLQFIKQRLNSNQIKIKSINNMANIVHNLENIIHETAERFTEQIQSHEQFLIRQIHDLFGINNMNLIENLPDHENQIELSNKLYKEIKQNLDGQDMDLLLGKTNLIKKLSQLNEINSIENNIEPINNKIYFQPGSVELGYLINDLSIDHNDIQTISQIENDLNVEIDEEVNLDDHEDDDAVVDDDDDEEDDNDDDNDDDDGSDEVDEDEEQYEDISVAVTCNSSNNSKSISLANRPCINSTACQTDINMDYFDNIQIKLFESKQYRSRGCNTCEMLKEDKETNTRPRGINTTISYSDLLSNTTSEEYLNNFNTDKLNFNEMDNLTRARIRRKLHERYHTFDHPGNSPNTMMNLNSISLSNGTTNHNDGSSNNINPNNDYVPRRFSSYDKRYHL